MKHKMKSVLTGCLVIILSVLLASCGFLGYGSAEKAEWPAQSVLKSLNIEDITSISYSLSTEGGVLSGVTEDAAEIEDIYLRLCHVTIENATTRGVDDDALRLEVNTEKATIPFDFEGDILVLSQEKRYEVSNLQSLKSYVQALLEETEDNYKVFASEKMGFSFLYEAENAAYITDTGAAELVIDGDESLVGLFVSCVDAENMPDVSEILEESMFNVQQQYQNAMVDQPEMDSLSIEGHDLTGIYYAYSNTDGKTIDCYQFIEVRDGKYIFYETAALREKSGPEQTAMGVAIGSIQFDADYYGESDAILKSESDDDWGRGDSAPTDWGRGDSAPVETGSSIKGGIWFDTDESAYLIISDEKTTQVYTQGVMSGNYFAVEKSDVSGDNIGEAVVQRKNDVTNSLGVRMATQPQVKTLSLGTHRLGGIEYAYSAADGSKTIEAAEYYEEINGQVYNWFAFYDRGDTVTYEAMKHAIETFKVT